MVAAAEADKAATPDDRPARPGLLAVAHATDGVASGHSAVGRVPPTRARTEPAWSRASVSSRLAVAPQGGSSDEYDSVTPGDGDRLGVACSWCTDLAGERAGRDRFRFAPRRTAETGRGPIGGTSGMPHRTAGPLTSPRPGFLRPCTTPRPATSTMAVERAVAVPRHRAYTRCSGEVKNVVSQKHRCGRMVLT